MKGETFDTDQIVRAVIRYLIDIEIKEFLERSEQELKQYPHPVRIFMAVSSAAYATHHFSTKYAAMCERYIRGDERIKTPEGNNVSVVHPRR